ncbi:MAG: FAD-dependent oxidoreductase [Anaerolineales bacterium]
MSEATRVPARPTSRGPGGPTSTVAIVGGGIFGVSAAIELHERGHHVTLFDPGPVPHPLAASTDITKMIRMDYGADESYMELMEEAFLGWDRWNAEWGEDLYHQTGFLLLSREPFAPGGFEHDSFQLLGKRGHPVERLDTRQLRERFPAWTAERYPDGYFNPRAGWAESGRVVARRVDQARALGIAIREGVAFDKLAEDDSRITGFVARDGSVFRSDVVVVAAGTWTPTLLPHLSEVMWSVGQPVLHFRPADPEAFRPPRFVPWAADIGHTGWYGFAALADGTLKIANHGPGRRIHPDDPREVSPGDEARFRAFLRESLPGLADAPIIGRRLCLYCDTWDGNFWIDRDPDRPGLVVASGGSGHAFKFGPMLGPLIADAVEGKPNRYAARFAWRTRGDLSKEDARHM